MPTSRKIVMAAIIGEMRALARGPSGMLIASTPASANFLTLESIPERSLERGGGISTLVIFSPASILRASFDFFSGGTTWTRMPCCAIGRTSTCRFTPLSDLIARPATRMWDGLVPQQPPTPRTPSSMYFFAYSVKYSGLVR
jgi:hypothetical protein